MIRALLLALALGGGWVGYVWLNDLMAREQFASAVETAIDDPRSRTVEQMRDTIVTAARGQGISLEPAEIDFRETEAAAEPLAGQAVARAGMATTTRRLDVRVRYARRIWGADRSVVVERAKVYVAAVSAAPGPEASLLDRAP